MNHFLPALLVLAALSSGASAPASAPESNFARTQRLLHDSRAPGVVVASHRACWQSASENSLDGIRACIDHGIDIIEIDVRETKDSRLVLMHDSTVDRMTNGHGKLSTLTFAQVRALRLKPGAGGRDMTELTDRQVPTLEEALAAAKGRIVINMDAKDPLQERIFTVVEQAGMTDQVLMKIQAAPDAPELADSRFAYRSMFIPVIFACKARMQIGQFCVDTLGQVVPGYARYHPVAFELNFEDPGFITPDAATAARAHGRLWANSLKPEQAGGVSDATALQDPDGVWGTLIDQGFTLILTDHPEALLAYLRKRGLHD